MNDKTFQRRLAVKLVEMYLTAMYSVESFSEILENTEKDLLMEFIDSLVDSAEKVILIEWPRQESNGDHFYSGG